MADFYKINGNRFRKLTDEELKSPGVKPWIGIEFTELGGLPIKKLYITDSELTYEVYKAPPISGGAYIYQIVNEITIEENPFLSALIKEKLDSL
jgi:hypothetical protein